MLKAVVPEGDPASLLHVLLMTEGTYPFHRGGVSTWCDALGHGMRGVRYTILAVVMNPYVVPQYALPPSVERVISVPLWGTQDPAEHRADLPFSQIFAKKQRTTPDVVSELFMPLFSELIAHLQRAEPDPEGFGQTLLGLYRYFHVYDYELSFKSPAPWAHFRERLLAACAAGRWPAPTVFDMVQALGWVYRFMTILNIPVPSADLAHSSAAAFCGVSAIVAKLHHRTPYLLTEHGVYLREQYLAVGRSDMGAFARSFLLALVRTVVVANLYHADELAPVCHFNGRWERRLGAEPRKIRPVYNGVSPATFSLGPSATGAAAAAPVRIVSVARMDPNKDIATLLRAAAIVREAEPRACFHVYGAVSVPDYHARMLELRRELGLEEVVAFHDHTDDVAEVYRQADVLVQSSVTEAFPYAVIEGMMAGRPVVATDVGGTAEAVGDAGILVPAREPALLAEALLRSIGDPALRARLGVAARRRALELFTIDRTIAEFAAVYRRLAVLRPSAAPGQVLELAVARAWALHRLGRADLARAQLDTALARSEHSPATPALLALRASLEGALGNPEAQMFDLIRARILADLQEAG